MQKTLKRLEEKVAGRVLKQVQCPPLCCCGNWAQAVTDCPFLASSAQSSVGGLHLSSAGVDQLKQLTWLAHDTFSTDTRPHHAVLQVLYSLASVSSAWQPRCSSQADISHDTHTIPTHAALQVLYSLASADAALQQRTAAALSRLVKDTDLRMVFLERRGLEILMDPLKDGVGTREAQLEAAGACSDLCL